MNKNILMILLLIAANLLAVAFSHHHPECGDSPTLKFKKLAKELGK